MRKPKKAGGRPDISDVAREAGVSISTVSRVINNPSSVKDYNRGKVEEAVKKLGFTPDVTAQRLANKRCTTVTLLLPYYENLFESFYILEILRGAGSVAAELQLDLLVHIANPEKLDDTINNVINSRSAQVIIFSDIESVEAVLERAVEHKIPSVVLNNYVDDMPVSCLDVDNKGGAISAIDYLVGLGHNKIATITGRLTVESGYARLEGYREGMKKHNIKQREDYIVEGDFRPQTGYIAMKKLLELNDIPTAVFIASDEMAAKAIEAIKEKGMRVPEDISIVGFDDHWIATYGEIPLTTVRQPMFELAARAVRLLYEFINGERQEPLKTYLATQLVVRKSCRRLS